MSDLPSQSDTDVHLRLLIDQRAARAHMHARFPSISDFSDSPSIYSPPFYSPRQMEQPPPSFTSPFRQPPTAHSSNAFHDPAASILDMGDDDPTPSVYDDDEESVHHSDDDDLDIPRMSLLGPKMRFHSKAPWEIEDVPLEEEDEDDASVNHQSALRKGFRLGTSPSVSGRRSGESTAQRKPKVSLDSSSSQASNARGTLSALAQASRSVSSLVSSAPSPGSTSRKKLPASRPPSPKPQHIHSTPVSPYDTSMSFISSNASTVRADQNRLDASTPLSRADTDDDSSYRHEPCHPYANPDLAMSYVSDSPPPSTRSLFTAPPVSRSDSVATVTESNTAGSSFSFAGARSTITPDTSTSSFAREVAPRKRSSTLHGREISSPLGGRRPDDMSPKSSQSQVSPPLPLHPGFSTLPTWNERAPSPTFALISLEEARAQRARSATVHHSSNDASSRSNDSDPEHDPFGISYGTTAARSRARSISAGARAKQALQSMVGNGAPAKFDRRDSEPAVAHLNVSAVGAPVKSLKHKKSGFMRLFNGREKEKDREPPPVPPLSDGFAAYQAQQVPKLKLSSYRVPVPPLEQPFNRSSETLPSSRGTSSAESSPIVNSNSNTASRKSSTSNLRRTPPLSINTTIPTWVATTTNMPKDQPASEIRGVPRSLHRLPSDSAPQSAPAHVTEFPSLKLRPVSTIFSAKFQEHLVANDEPSLDADGDPSPTTASTLVSPLTPVGFGRSDTGRNICKALSDNGSINGPGGRASIGGSDGEEARVTIRALQDQIVSAKQAWQRQIWELEGQVRDLKQEVEDLRSASRDKTDLCELCGRTGSGGIDSDAISEDRQRAGVVNRPRARTGTAARFGSAF